MPWHKVTPTQFHLQMCASLGCIRRMLHHYYQDCNPLQDQGTPHFSLPDYYYHTQDQHMADGTDNCCRPPLSVPILLQLDNRLRIPAVTIHGIV